MTETDIQAALDRARGARKIDVCLCPADVEALVAEVRRLQNIEMFTRCEHSCATSGCTETSTSGICGKCTLTERDQLRARAAELELNQPWRRCADALADEVAALTWRKVIDTRSPAADALLDYRNPPVTPRADRLAQTDAQLAIAVEALEVIRDAQEPGYRVQDLRDHASAVIAKLRGGA